VASPSTSSAPAPIRARRGRHLPRSTWDRLVLASVLVLVAVAIFLAVDWIATAETRVTTYAVTGSPTRIVLDAHSGNVDLLGGGTSAVEVRRTEHLSYGHRAKERRSITRGVLRIDSTCPTVIVGRCSADYRLTVPDNVPITVQTDEGEVHLAAFRGSATIESDSGDVTADAFCGFSLAITTGSGNASVSTACSPQRLSLRSDSGDVEATVPPGRYRVTAETENGDRSVSGITPRPQAPFAIEAVTSRGDVTVRGAP
jgi:hypothetical protein